MLSMVPPKLKWIIETIGFVGNRAKGISHIRKASELDNFRGWMSRVILMQITTMFYEDYTTAE